MVRFGARVRPIFIQCLGKVLFGLFPLIIHLSANEPPPPYQKELDSALLIEVDYLLWFSTPDGLHSPTVATGASPQLDSNWSSGVRVAIGGEPARWDTEACYTYYTTNGKGQSNANINAILSSTPSTAGIFEVGKTWHLTFNRLDLQLGRKMLFDSPFLLEPFFGLEGLAASQKFDLNTNTIFLDLTTALPATNIVNSNNSNSLLAIGPRAGFKAEFDFKGGFGLYGNLGANILWSHFKIKQKYNETNYYSSSSPTVLVDQSRQVSQNGALFNADLEMGFSWRYLFEKRNIELALKGGWEQHYYIDIVRFHDFYLQQTSLGTAAYTTDGNLSLSGVTFGALLRY